MYATAPAQRAVLTRRLLPLWIATFLQGVGFWVPVEKLFLSEIGFNAATVGVMAAAYAAVVPFAEIASGFLADRWSRRGVLMLAGVALGVSVLIGALSHNVITYIVAALILGLYFAMYSGTVEAVVYDVVLEETGSGQEYERRIGWVRFVESIALVGSSLAGGWIAAALSPRATYFLTLPFAVLYLVALTRFREPTLHRTGQRIPLRRYSRMIDRRRLVPVAAATVLAAMLLQAVYEFGPLWLVTLRTGAGYYGPFWALLVGMLGVGGLLAGRLHLERLSSTVLAVLVMVAACVTMTSSRNLVALTVAMTALTFLLVAVGIHLSQLLHDAVPSTIRTGAASAVSAVSWLVFAPFALVFGSISKHTSVFVSGWMIIGGVLVGGAALVWVQRHDVALR